jgi:hypothetical protein
MRGWVFAAILACAACAPATSTPATSSAAGAATGTVAPTTPAPTPFHFGSGQKTIGTEVPAGTYRTRQAATGCYWQRVSGFGGTVGEILANDNTNGPAVVTIAASDKGFSSTRCGEWSADLSAITKTPTDPFAGEGTFIVGTDIAAGTWRATGGTSCYWQRIAAFSGEAHDIIANDNVTGPVTVTISATDKGFTSTRCGTWTKIG